jgi:CheY-like chemotaxis protein
MLAGRVRIFTMEYPCHAPHEERWFQLIAMADSAGPEPHFLVVHLPITERRLAEKRVVIAQQKAEGAAAAKARFLAAAAHDLRQSVQAAMLFYQFLPQDPTAAEARGRLGASLDGLQQSVEALVEISRLDAGGVEPDVRVFAVDPLLERLWIEFAPIAEARGIDFRRVRTTAMAESDPDLLADLLRSLLSNALTYARRGTVLLGCRRSRSGLRVCVCDTGPGIADHEKSLIFEEFYRGDHFGHDRSKGMGLGLSVVKRIAALLEERVTVRSRHGRGSSFEVTVRRAGTGAPTVRSRRRLEKPLRARLIAVIDDDAAALNELRLYYEFLGHDVLAATSASAAILQLGRRHRVPDAVVAARRADTGGETGRDAIRQLRQAFGEDIPGILLTGEEVPGAWEGGGVRLLPERAALRELALALDDILDD